MAHILLMVLRERTTNILSTVYAQNREKLKVKAKHRKTQESPECSSECQIFPIKNRDLVLLHIFNWSSGDILNHFRILTVVRVFKK